MNHRPAFLSVLLLLPILSPSQTTKQDPFQDHYLLRDRKQLAVLKTNSIAPTHQVYDFVNLPGIGDSLLASDSSFNYDNYDPNHTLRFLFETGRDGGIDMTTGNIAFDRQDEVISAWHIADRSLLVVISGVEPYTHNWIHRGIVLLGKDSLYTEPDSAISHCNTVRVLCGKFDGDEYEEWLLAYIAADSTLRLKIYDTGPGVQVSEQKLFVRIRGTEDGYGTKVERFNVAVADLDGDGTDEIVVAGVEPAGTNGWSGFLKTYDVNLPAQTITPRGKLDLFYSATSTGSNLPHGIRVMAANFDTTAGMECVVAWRNSLNPVVALVRVSQDLQTISLADSMTIPETRSGDSWLSLASGDLNSDDVAEIVVSSKDTLRIFGVGAGHTLVQLRKTQPVTLPDETRDYFVPDGLTVRGLVVADVNSDSSSSWVPEIVAYQTSYPVGKPVRYRIHVYAVTVDTAGAITGISSISNKSIASSDMGVLAAGSFDPKDVRFGPPRVFTKSAIVQPLVVLNAPPIHFDVFGGTSYDVSKMFGTGVRNFVSTYEKLSESTLEIETKISRSWSRSTSLSGGVSGPYGLGVSENLTSRYGAGFSKEDRTSSTIRIAVKDFARDDDRIYATVAQYDIWEYPAYAAETLIGHVLVLDPNSVSVQHGWFPSKDPTALSYVPNHEVGNILSYQRYADLRENPDLGQLVKGSNNVFFALDANSSPEWYLKFSDFQAEGASTTRTANMEVGASVSGFGISVGVSENYSDESVYTHRTSVMSDLSLKVQLGSLDMGIGEVRYSVTPYTYWGKNGALVLDYAVAPSQSEPGQTPTWWQVRYNKQDPAFILPWRYDPQKGYTLQDSAKRLQTKEITFLPPNAGRGDTVLIVAAVRNFGLVNTAVPVAVRFYLGHPDSGGTPLVGTNGLSKVLTDGLLPARSWKKVQLPWRIPMDIPQFPRIYGVINPDTVMDEVHTNNNIGFAVLNLSSLPTGVVGGERLPGGFALAQNYPNPFNPSTVIRYELPERAYVRLVVYDLLGRVVERLVDEVMPAGRHQVVFNTRALATGVYFYRIQAGGFVSTKKMLTIK